WSRASSRRPACRCGGRSTPRFRAWWGRGSASRTSTGSKGASAPHPRTDRAPAGGVWAWRGICASGAPRGPLFLSSSPPSLSSPALAPLDQRCSGIITSPREGVRDAVAPVQDLADGAINPAVDFFDNVGRANRLERENRDLRRRLAQSKGERADAKAANAKNT